MPCGRAIPKTASRSFQSGPPAAVCTPMNTPRRTISLIVVVDDKDVLHFRQFHLLGGKVSQAHKRTARGVQGGKRGPQASCPAGGPPLKWP
jgi:phosphatidylethanolamine-binding protein (PEBP) family uncharacterized protein